MAFQVISLDEPTLNLTPTLTLRLAVTHERLTPQTMLTSFNHKNLNVS